MTTMESVAKDFGDHVMEMETEYDSHATKAAAAADASGLGTLDGTHRTTALGVLTKMDEMIKHMGMCSNASNKTPDLKVSMDAMAKLRTAAEAHAAAIAAIPGLTDARAEETRHRTEMGTQLALMKTHSATLKTGASMYMCSSSSMGTGH